MASSPTLLAGQDMTADVMGVPAWTAMTGSYMNSFSDLGGGNAVGQYRLWKLLNSVEVIGNIQHISFTGTLSFFTLPAALFPATAQAFAAISGTSSGNQIAGISITSAGVLSVTSAAAATFVQFHGWISLDA